MAQPETTVKRSVLDYPLPVFRFVVNFTQVNNNDDKPLCAGAFSECSGIEATMEPKTIKVGGQNYGEVQRFGRVNFATIILKRGVCKNRDLWNWFQLVNGGGYGFRLNAEIILLDFGESKSKTPVMKWEMKNALPTKFKAADLNSTANQVGIEELHFVHEGMTHGLIKAESK